METRKRSGSELSAKWRGWAAAALILWAIAAPVRGLGAAAKNEDAPPPSTGGFFPLSQVHRGLMATAWTVFEGAKPEPMQVEILGILRGARGPGQDLILARLHGAKPEYTGVVEGMSGSPVYVGDKLLGSLSYRIGQFSKEPIAGITPIAQMLEVRGLPIQGSGIRDQGSEGGDQAEGSPWRGPEDRDQGTGIGEQAALANAGMQMQPMETPLVMSGFSPAAIEFWRSHVQLPGLETVAAGGMGESESGDAPDTKAEKTLEPGSAISALLVRGDLEISATCTVTYIDPKQLLACGHPVLQSGPISLPMTTAEVVATLASPLNAFKIINTGATVGAFTEDRESAIGGVLGATARMIPMHITLEGAGAPGKVNVEILDQPSLTPQAVEVVLYESLLERNESTSEMSYHVTGTIELEDFPPLPVDSWASGGEVSSAQLLVAAEAAARFNAIYTNGERRGLVRAIDLHVDAIPRRLSVALQSARLVSSDLVHAGDTVEVEATLRPWQQAERNVRISVKLPERLESGNVRLLVSDAATLDRTLNQPKLAPRAATMASVLARARREHAADRIYVSILAPETQAGWDGETLAAMPLSMANALEPVRNTDDISLNGESAEEAGDVPAGGLLSGFQILNVHIDAGGGLN
ncbi:MAG: SpoIVB peptidase S55 [Terracidiphilus sp.]